MNGIRWSLLNVKTLQKQGKKFYLSPKKTTIYQHLRQKAFFQLIVKSNNQKKKFIAVEKLWCRFLGRKDGHYLGQLVSIPKLIKDLTFGDQIDFCAEHVLACLSPQKVQQNFALNQSRNLAFLNKALLQQTNLPTQWVREMPSQINDTGWRLIAAPNSYLLDTNEFAGFNPFTLDDSGRWKNILRGEVGTRLDENELQAIAS
ncbi:MAG: hypothetical protein AB8G15_10995 [Saprospiraceae bacterium]